MFVGVVIDRLPAKSTRKRHALRACRFPSFCSTPPGPLAKTCLWHMPTLLLLMLACRVFNSASRAVVLQRALVCELLGEPRDLLARMQKGLQAVGPDEVSRGGAESGVAGKVWWRG